MAGKKTDRTTWMGKKADASTKATGGKSLNQKTADRIKAFSARKTSLMQLRRTSYRPSYRLSWRLLCCRVARKCRKF